MLLKSGSFDEPVIFGPLRLFDGSFILEFLQPHPVRDATSVAGTQNRYSSSFLTSPFIVLIRITYKHDHPLCKKGL